MLGRNLIVKVSDGAQAPTYAHEGDAGLDLRIVEDVTLQPNERKVVGTGLYMEIPLGCVGILATRSGLATKRGITLANAIGVIDSGYRGEVGAALWNTSDKVQELKAGERVCQLIVMPFVPCKVMQEKHLTATDRGADGFGSTGTK